MEFSLNIITKSKRNLFKKYFNFESEQKNCNEKKNLKKESENISFRKSRKLYSINISNNINKKMKEIEKKGKYKRNIYKLLYDQIHTDIAEIEKEIKTARNIIVPYSLLRRRQIKNEILLNKKLNKADIEELKKEENIQIKNNKINIPKIKVSNISNNIFNRNTILNTPKKKDNKTNSFIAPSKFKNRSNTKIIKTRNKPIINIIKSATEDNGDSNDYFFKKGNDNIETTFNKMIYKNKDYLKTEIGNNNTSFKRLNSKSLSKNDTKTSLIKENIETKNQKRKKCLFVSYDEKWYLKNKFLFIRLDKLEIENNYIQSQIISDQYYLINENINLITSKYLVDKELTNKFNSINYSNKQIININIEDSIGLMLKISYILLEKFEENLEKFITQIIKKPEKKDITIVEDEKKEFTINLALFTEASSFFSVSFKSYLILLEKDEYFKINSNNFDKIYQFFDRLRLSVNKIILDFKSLYNGNNVKETKIIKECVHKIIKIKEQKLAYEKKPKLDCHRKFGYFRSGIDPFKYKGNVKMKLTEEKEVNMRINNSIGKKNDTKKNFSTFQKFDIGSKLVSNLMKYGTKEFREFIIYERIRRRFHDKENENQSNYDSN